MPIKGYRSFYHSFCPLTQKRIEIKEFAAGLAYELFLYHIKNDKEIPKVLMEWKSICTNSEEFIEIRKQWKS